MIPKTIHYCWFGGNPKSGLIRECMQSWENHLKGYKIIEWNEANFDVNICKYTRQAYEKSKWAFVSDYARLWALYNYGGVYLDTDVEVLKSLDGFLSQEAFSGFENSDCPITAVLGAKKGNSFIYNLLREYDNRSFLMENGMEDLKTNTITIADYLISRGIKPNGKMQTANDFTIYPQIYFCPNNLSRIWNKPSKWSYSIHHFDQSWCSNTTKKKNIYGRIRRYVIGRLRNVIGTKKVLYLQEKMLSNKSSGKKGSI